MKKDRLTIYLQPELAERARRVVYWTPVLTLANLTAAALTLAVDELEQRRGEPFPPREGALKTGNQIG